MFALLITGWTTCGITTPPLYPATLLPSPAFTYNFTAASAHFSFGPYMETRHYTNTSTLTGLPDPSSSSYSFYSILSRCAYNGFSLVRGVGPGLQYSRQPTGDTVPLPFPGCSIQQAASALVIVALPLCAVSSILGFVFSTVLATVVENHRAGVQPGWTDHVDAGVVGKYTRGNVGVLVLIGLASVDLLALLACVLAWTRADELRGGEWNAGLYVFIAGVAYSLVALWVLGVYNCYQLSQLSDVPPAQAPGHLWGLDAGGVPAPAAVEVSAANAVAQAEDLPGVATIHAIRDWFESRARSSRVSRTAAATSEPANASGAQQSPSSPSSSAAIYHAMTSGDRSSSMSQLSVNESARDVGHGDVEPDEQPGVSARVMHESFTRPTPGVTRIHAAAHALVTPIVTCSVVLLGTQRLRLQPIGCAVRRLFDCAQWARPRGPSR